MSLGEGKANANALDKANEQTISNLAIDTRCTLDPLEWANSSADCARNGCFSYSLSALTSN
jgi:hypothetical protein